MKSLTKYIINELIGPFLIGLGFFTFILILSPITRLIDMLIVKRVPLWESLLLFAYYLPSTVAISLPMATLVAVLMAYGRLSSDSEVIAMRASGIGYWRIFYPAIILSLVISVFAVIFNDTVLPRGNYAFQKMYAEIAKRKPLTQIEEHTLTDISNKKAVRFIGVDSIDRKDMMHGVIIHERNNITHEIQTIIAKKGRWLKSVERKEPDGRILLVMRLLLEEGSMQRPDKDNLDEFSNIPFKKFIVNIPQEIAFSTSVTKGSREKTIAELKSDIKRQQPLILEGIKNQQNIHIMQIGKLQATNNRLLREIKTAQSNNMNLLQDIADNNTEQSFFKKAGKQNTNNFMLMIRINKHQAKSKVYIKNLQKQPKIKWKPYRLRVEYHKRYSIPFAALAFVLIGLPFSIVSGRSGKSVSLGISIIIIFVYYMLYILGESLGKAGTFPEYAALWLPNLIFVCVGLYKIYKVAQT